MRGLIGQGNNPSRHEAERTAAPLRLIGGRLLRCGYTTGTCAAAAAKAAATMLLTGALIDTIHLDTPDGTGWQLEVLDAAVSEGQASCAVRKDAGDDPDATDGALIYVTVTRQQSGISIDGGAGIGRVTKAGLDQLVGVAAINSIPRQMIQQAVQDAADEAGDPSGWHVVVSCPMGEQIAVKTFNPRLGVIGGISILGTTGVVEPMSNAALVETMGQEIAVMAAAGTRDLLVVLGNFGESFARETLGLTSVGESSSTSKLGVVKSSNFIDDAINHAAEKGFKRVLVIGHVGKMAKVGIGMLNTHSATGDGRLETLVACALEAGANTDLLREILDCASTDAALMLLNEHDLMTPTVAVLARRIQATFDRYVPDSTDVEWLCFMRAHGVFTEIARSKEASTLIERWRTL